MSIQGGVGAEAMAEDVIRFVKERLVKLGAGAAEDPERATAEEELQAVLAFAEAAREMAKSGWY